MYSITEAYDTTYRPLSITIGLNGVICKLLLIIKIIIMTIIIRLIIILLMITLINGVASIKKTIRTSKGDYWIKQWFNSIASLFIIGTSLKGKNLLPEGATSIVEEQFLMTWKNHFYHVRWPPLDVTIFITHVRNCVMGATPMLIMTKAQPRPLQNTKLNTAMLCHTHGITLTLRDTITVKLLWRHEQRCSLNVA